MNAVAHLVVALPRHALRRLGADRDRGDGDVDLDVLRARVVARWELDLAGLLNAARKDELLAFAAHCKLGAGDDDHAALRARLWTWGAAAEWPRGAAAELAALQPRPILLRGRLVHQGALPGLAPPSAQLPRPIPPVAAATAPSDEPDSVEELLAAADRLLGVRLGLPGRDKGAFGADVAALLGVAERGAAEPDWRGEVEIKTVPVIADRAGRWRVKEDPAVSMATASPLAKLRRVLWVARVAGGDSPILSWWFQEWDGSPGGELGRLFARHLHTRPKGGAGATTRGWYLHKRFFVASGFLRSLNGQATTSP